MDDKTTTDIKTDSTEVTMVSSTAGTQDIKTQTTDTTDVTDKTLADRTKPDVAIGADDDTSKSEIFLLKGKEYKNIKCLSDSSGEAQVFLVENGGTEYVLKLYYPNYKTKKNLIRTIMNLDFDMVMQVYDYGKTYVDGSHREYDLMEYLQGGTLKEYTLDGDMTQFRRIALQAAAALSYCHNNQIIHKDIKPSNFFFRDAEHNELVLGDFGISSLCANDEDLENHRTTQARTPAYAAPEIYTDVIDGEVVISPAVDYYSLGLTLFTLWLGRNPLSNNERVMMRQKSEGRLPHLKELPDRVRMIITGLTSVNPQTRWNYDQVESWFKGEDVAVDTSAPSLKYKSFVVDPERNLVADNVYELVPMLYDNQKIAIDYLYNRRISNWLEECGNTKLNVAVDDIIQHRYPADKKAGLMACLYILDSKFPYYDIRGNACSDIHAVTMSLLSYQKEYALQLRDPNDALFLYLEVHANCDISRLRTYYRDTETEGRIAILRTVYEIDPDMPFMAKYPSSTVEEISSSFGNYECSEDDWQSLCDGRLLSWMYSHSSTAACEALSIFIKEHKYSKALAYEVLYNIDRDSAFDLRQADTPEKVGIELNKLLRKCQNFSDEDFKKNVEDYTDLNGRLMYYAQLHGWVQVTSECKRCFNLMSEENRERLGAYDLKTATYRFCRILGVVPTYVLEDGKELTDGRKLSKKYIREIRSEIRHGNFCQWLSVFYHENPEADFSSDYSYEHTLENYLLVIGEFDMMQKYYKRFVDAKANTEKMTTDSHRKWNLQKAKVQIWRGLFITASIIWILLLLIVGISNFRFFTEHIYWTVALPAGICTMAIVMMRAYLNGYGVTISFLFGLLGVASAVVVALILKWLFTISGAVMIIGIVVFTILYVVIGLFSDHSKANKDVGDLNEYLENDDIKTSLLEPLYYTFKTKSANYKGSKFGALEDITNQVTSTTGVSIIHYKMWITFIIVIILELVLFSPKLANVPNPDFGALKTEVHQLIHQIKDTK